MQRYDRLTSPEFHRKLSLAVLRVELEKKTDPVETSILVKHVLAMEKNYMLLKQIVALSKTNLAWKTVLPKLAESGCKGGDREWLSEIFLNPDLLELFLSNLNSIDFYAVLDFATNLPTRTIPIIEAQILLHPPQSEQEIASLVHVIHSEKLGNMSVFELAAKAMLKATCSIRPGTALRFVREFGFAGLTHSALMEKLWPIFSNFKNYQALSSVFILVGPLTQPLVDLCMSSVRADMKRDKTLRGVTPPSVEGHAQLIRRLVVSGFPKEAMEVFSHFPANKFALINTKNEISQIYRLYLASYLWPETVPRASVACLRREALIRRTDDGVKGSSFIHSLVVSALRRLQIEHVSEYTDPETLLMIDVFVPSLNLAIEVQGPSHYYLDLHTGNRSLRPEDEFKLNVLKAAKINVEQLSVYDFGRNNATRNSDEKISQILAKYAK